MHDHVDHDEPPAPLKFDRRRSGRVGTHGAATGFRLGGEGFGRIYELELLDYSDSGLCATSDVPIEPGVHLSIGFGQGGRLARRGIVTRCLPCGDGYRVGIQFQLGLAA